MKISYKFLIFCVCPRIIECKIHRSVIKEIKIEYKIQIILSRL